MRWNSLTTSNVGGRRSVIIVPPMEPESALITSRNGRLTRITTATIRIAARLRSAYFNGGSFTGGFEEVVVVQDVTTSSDTICLDLHALVASEASQFLDSKARQPISVQQNVQAHVWSKISIVLQRRLGRLEALKELRRLHRLHTGPHCGALWCIIVDKYDVTVQEMLELAGVTNISQARSAARGKVLQILNEVIGD